MATSTRRGSNRRRHGAVGLRPSTHEVRGARLAGYFLPVGASSFHREGNGVRGNSVAGGAASGVGNTARGDEIVSRRCLQYLACYCSLLALLAFAGCASLRTSNGASKGETGAIRWEAVDSTVRGNNAVAIYQFTLILRETAGRPITFAVMNYKLPLGPPGVRGGKWQLPANGELRIPLQSLRQCKGPCTGRSAKGSEPLTYELRFTGIDDTNQSVSASMAVTPPPPKDIGSDTSWSCGGQQQVAVLAGGC